MRREPPEAVRTLQRKLYRKAKAEPTFRVYLLYDKVHRPDVLQHAGALGRANGGAAGVDGTTLAAVEAGGVGPFLAHLAEELRPPTDRSDPVRRVAIPKRRGGERPLGIPTVRDRVVQAAARLVLAPLFEADFQPCAYGFRPKKDAHQAMEAIRTPLAQGDTQVLDADLTAYFDSIPHDRLLAAVARRVADRHILRLCTRGSVPRWGSSGPTGSRRREAARGLAAGPRRGGAISPLLANGYLHAFDTAWRAGGLERRWQARLIRYAEDFVVLCRAKGDEVQTVVAEQRQALGLTLNAAKTRGLDARRQAFTCLGCTVRVVRSPRTGRGFPLIRPSAAACQRLRDQVKALTGRDHLALPTPAVITAVNRVVRGWAGYFYFQHCSRDFSALRWFLEERVRTYLRRTHGSRSRGYRAFPHAVLYGRLGLHRLPMRAPWTSPTHAGR